MFNNLFWGSTINRHYGNTCTKFVLITSDYTIILSSSEIYMRDFYIEIFGQLGFHFSGQIGRSKNIFGKVFADFKSMPCNKFAFQLLNLTLKIMGINESRSNSHRYFLKGYVQLWIKLKPIIGNTNKTQWFDLEGQNHLRPKVKSN